jgi:hypothetical protein
MALTIDKQTGFITGGNPSSRVTPNFQLKEYRQANGKYFIHRELAAAVQELRDLYGNAINISSLPSDATVHGRAAWVACNDIASLAKYAKILVDTQFVKRFKVTDEKLYLEISDPENMPPLRPDNAMKRAIRVTAAFETSGDPFLQVTGNFDGAGLSFGPLQVNFKSKTLPTVFEKFEKTDATLLKQCFENDADWNTWQRILRKPVAQQIQWADSLSSGNNKGGFKQPWKRYLQNVGRQAAFQQQVVDYAYHIYGRKLIRNLSWLQGLTAIRINNFACLSALYDLCVQQGSLDKAHDAIRSRVAIEHPRSQIELMHIALEERGKTANVKYRADCVSRRLGILYRERKKITLNGFTSNRANRRLYLVRQGAVKDVEDHLT